MLKTRKFFLLSLVMIAALTMAGAAWGDTAVWTGGKDGTWETAVTYDGSTTTASDTNWDADDGSGSAAGTGIAKYPGQDNTAPTEAKIDATASGVKNADAITIAGMDIDLATLDVTADATHPVNISIDPSGGSLRAENFGLQIREGSSLRFTYANSATVLTVAGPVTLIGGGTEAKEFTAVSGDITLPPTIAFYNGGKLINGTAATVTDNPLVFPNYATGAKLVGDSGDTIISADTSANAATLKLAAGATVDWLSNAYTAETPADSIVLVIMGGALTGEATLLTGALEPTFTVLGANDKIKAGPATLSNGTTDIYTVINSRGQVEGGFGSATFDSFTLSADSPLAVNDPTAPVNITNARAKFKALDLNGHALIAAATGNTPRITGGKLSGDVTAGKLSGTGAELVGPSTVNGMTLDGVKITGTVTIDGSFKVAGMTLGADNVLASNAAPNNRIAGGAISGDITDSSTAFTVAGTGAAIVGPTTLSGMTLGDTSKSVALEGDITLGASATDLATTINLATVESGKTATLKGAVALTPTTANTINVSGKLVIASKDAVVTSAKASGAVVKVAANGELVITEAGTALKDLDLAAAASLDISALTVESQDIDLEAVAITANPLLTLETFKAVEGANIVLPKFTAIGDTYAVLIKAAALTGITSENVNEIFGGTAAKTAEADGDTDTGTDTDTAETGLTFLVVSDDAYAYIIAQNLSTESETPGTDDGYTYTVLVDATPAEKAEGYVASADDVFAETYTVKLTWLKVSSDAVTSEDITSTVGVMWDLDGEEIENADETSVFEFVPAEILDITDENIGEHVITVTGAIQDPADADVVTTIPDEPVDVFTIKILDEDEIPDEGDEGDDNPGDDNPGDDNPGDDNPGDDTPGNDNPGGGNGGTGDNTGDTDTGTGAGAGTGTGTGSGNGTGNQPDQSGQSVTVTPGAITSGNVGTSDGSKAEVVPNVKLSNGITITQITVGENVQLKVLIISFGNFEKLADAYSKIIPVISRGGKVFRGTGNLLAQSGKAGVDVLSGFAANPLNTGADDFTIRLAGEKKSGAKAKAIDQGEGLDYQNPP